MSAHSNHEVRLRAWSSDPQQRQCNFAAIQPYNSTFISAIFAYFPSSLDCLLCPSAVLSACLLTVPVLCWTTKTQARALLSSSFCATLLVDLPTKLGTARTHCWKSHLASASGSGPLRRRKPSRSPCRGVLVTILQLCCGRVTSLSAAGNGKPR